MFEKVLKSKCTLLLIYKCTHYILLLDSPAKVLGIFQNTSIQLNQAQSETEGKLFIRENDQLGLILASILKEVIHFTGEG